MNLIEKAIIVILVIAIAISLALLAITANDAVSLNCRRACAHVDGSGWVDCVLMCEGR